MADYDEARGPWLPREALRDRLDAAEAEAEAQVWERTLGSLAADDEGPPALRRLGQNRLCGRGTLYCPHRPACPRAE